MEEAWVHAIMFIAIRPSREPSLYFQPSVREPTSEYSSCSGERVLRIDVGEPADRRCTLVAEEPPMSVFLL